MYSRAITKFLLAAVLVSSVFVFSHMVFAAFNTGSGATSLTGTSPNVNVTNTSSTPVQVSLATLISGEDLTNNVLYTESHYTNNYISTTNSTTTIKSGAGYVHTLSIGTAATGSVITVFDSTTAAGTVIFKRTLPATILNDEPPSVILDVTFTTGLTVQQTGNTSTISVSYR